MGRALLVFSFLLVRPAWAGWDAFSDERQPPRFAIEGPDGLRLVLKGRADLAWRDLEGAGGEGHDSRTDTVTLGTRSGTARLERVLLAPRLVTDEGLAFLAELEFDDRAARARAAWFDFERDLGPLDVHLEAGLNVPFVAIDDLTLREPLTSRIYWGRREVHLTAEAGARGRLGWTLGVSLGLMRPLVTALVNDASERGTLAVVGSGDAESFSGNAPVYGARAALVWAGVRLEAFGYRGTLSAERGYDELRTRMANYALLPGFDAADPRRQDDTFWWAGGRLDARLGGAELRVEAIESAESLLRRRAGYAQVGYVWRRSEHPRAFLRTVEPRARAEYYRLVGADRRLAEGRALRAVDPSQALTWDWDVLTLALTTQLYGELLRLHVEHSLVREANGAPAAGQAQADVDNDETTAALELRW